LFYKKGNMRAALAPVNMTAWQVACFLMKKWLAPILSAL